MGLHLIMTSHYTSLNARTRPPKFPFDDGDGEDDIWYNDYKTQTCINKKFVFDDTYNLSRFINEN
jgi:hypothetical protein